MTLTEQQQVLIEKFGVFYEQKGMTPVESRIMALLLISDEIELSFDEIRETLEISKSATSNALNILLKTNKTEYITKTGDRKRYFRSRISNWENDSKGGLMDMLVVNDLLKEALAIRTPKTEKFNKDLENITKFIDFLQKELVLVFEKWKNQQ